MSLWGWALFAVLVLSAIAYDLGLLNGSQREQRTLSVRAATIRSALWIALALGFGLGITAMYGRDSGLGYFTAYLLEESLSIDNVFVFVLIFSELQIPPDQPPFDFYGVRGKSAKSSSRRARFARRGLPGSFPSRRYSTASAFW